MEVLLFLLTLEKLGLLLGVGRLGCAQFFLDMNDEILESFLFLLRMV